MTATRPPKPSDEGHGPECPMGNHAEHPWKWTQRHGWVRHNGQNIQCQCVLCHCGADSDPTGFLGSCTRCHRPPARSAR
jgi:hypothetical protein